MIGSILLILGAVMMAIGLATLSGWVNGRGGLSDHSRAERQLMNLYFITLVVAPLLVGAVLIAMGLGKLT